MKPEQIVKARYYAAYDIAYRWFAFFEGETEEISEHLDIFSPDVELVHAGTHTLAKGKKSMEEWLRNLPYEKGSHFIRRFEMTALKDNQATINMDIGYQMMDVYGRVGGALSEYQTTVEFDTQQNARFTFLQKTPRFHNPDRTFRDSFTENRMHSFIAHFFFLLLTSKFESITSMIAGKMNENRVQGLVSLLHSSDINKLSIESLDTSELKCVLLIPVAGVVRKLNLRLTESAGRYLLIQHADWA